MIIISGCQTGADQGGLEAAFALDLATRGYVTRNNLTEEGFRPDLCARFGLKQLKTLNYLDRTKANVQAADATLIIGRRFSGGSRQTAMLAFAERKPFLFINPRTDRAKLMQQLAAFLTKHQPAIINIAGNRESKAPGIQAWTKDFLIEALSKEPSS